LLFLQLNAKYFFIYLLGKNFILKTLFSFRYTFMGFGQGPRSCIAMRFALLEAKVALSSVVQQFDLNVCSKTVEKIELDPKLSMGGNIGGLWIKAVARQA
jgi:hypothetical protein